MLFFHGSRNQQRQGRENFGLAAGIEPSVPEQAVS